MDRLDELFSRSNEVKEQLEQILRLEKDVEHKEKMESIELMKAKKIASRLRSDSSFSHEDEVEEELFNDFVEAASIFKDISVELDKTADDFHQVIEEIRGQTGEELKIIEGLANNSFQIKNESKVEELSETLDSTRLNINNLIKESKMAKEEAKEAQSELESLIELEGFIEDIDNSRHNLSEPISSLENSKSTLEDAEWKLGEVPHKIDEANQNNHKAQQVIENKVTRRKAVRTSGAFSVAALTGLAGCQGTSDASIYETPEKYRSSSDDLHILEVHLRSSLSDSGGLSEARVEVKYDEAANNGEKVVVVGSLSKGNALAGAVSNSHHMNPGEVRDFELSYSGSSSAQSIWIETYEEGESPLQELRRSVNSL